MMSLLDYQARPDLLQGKVILVTGAGDGIGRVAARHFAAHGATLVLLGRTVKKLTSLYDEIEQHGGPQPAIYPMNLEGATPKDYDDLASSLREAFGRLDGLLLNAAELGSLTPIEHYPIETWYKVLQVNLHANFMLTQACLPLLKAAPHASVLFSSSSVGHQGRAYWGAYAVSKSAGEGLMQVLADELESQTQVRVNSLNPGKCRTQMRAKAYPAEDRNSLPSPESLMPAYLYLMGDDSLELNGQSLHAQS